jgi:hypothetical protein
MSKQALSIVGSIRRNGAREENDFYPTPHHAIKSLLDRHHFDGSVWEPACGDGAISNVLLSEGFYVESSDLIDRGFGEVGIDFLQTDRKIDNIITNPPFNLALEFVDHAKKCADQQIAMFLKTTFLEGAKRYGMFKDTKFPLARMYQFCKRVNLYKGCETRDKSKISSGMIAFAWFVWDKEHEGSATIDWII